MGLYDDVKCFQNISTDLDKYLAHLMNSYLSGLFNDETDQEAMDIYCYDDVAKQILEKREKLKKSYVDSMQQLTTAAAECCKGKDELVDSARMSAYRSSPMMTILVHRVDVCLWQLVQFVDGEVLKELVPHILDLLKSSVALGTKHACSFRKIQIVKNFWSPWKMAISEPKSAHLREVLLLAFNWKKSATEAHRMLEEVYGDHALSKSQCYRWFKKFQSGDFELDNEPHGKPPQKFEDAELQALLDEDSTQMQEKLAKQLQPSTDPPIQNLKCKNKEAKFITLPFINQKFARNLTNIFKKYEKIKIAWKPCNTISQYLNQHKNTQLTERAGLIYEVKCEKCDQSYLGQTSRTLKERMENHKYALKCDRIQNSALVEHRRDTGHNKFNLENPRTLDYEKKLLQKTVQRSLFHPKDLCFN
ncbi:hypothetical protein LAZ67_13002332 [Cordylochernes scorpioides]|uniref:Mos1 transposase HTH domain-containing protein n=1 Tax=Cordylochernes scorpioides TaxID=51811 RepID=A0ABY6L6Z9_9ARAC|nr:hypothetical protein LAZ67_13002332 [Cordylochernes scorpioides]